MLLHQALLGNGSQQWTFLRFCIQRLLSSLLALASTAIPGFSLLEFHDYYFRFLLHTYSFRNGGVFETKIRVSFTLLGAGV
jgi:hypothetical protein